MKTMTFTWASVLSLVLLNAAGTAVAANLDLTKLPPAATKQGAPLPEPEVWVACWCSESTYEASTMVPNPTLCCTPKLPFMTVSSG